jgi:pantoate--beta-alanine ligase
MEVIREAKSWQKIRFHSEHQEASVGYVPTMGALHRGHVSLIERARRENDIVVSSIFVNPTQFNDAQDLENYPRTLDDDAKLAEAAGCDYLFVPEVHEIYGENLEVDHVDLGLLTNSLEGHFRPGHFNGVVAVVKKLLQAIQPNRAYFGKKDFQQLAIIREMARLEAMDVDIIGCDLVRDPEGLALSSRNMRLSDSQKKQALALNRVLFWMAEKALHWKPVEVENWGREALMVAEGIDLEYLEVVNGSDFRKYAEWKDYDAAIALCAAFVGEVRLIDNLQVFPVEEIISLESSGQKAVSSSD